MIDIKYLISTNSRIILDRKLMRILGIKEALLYTDLINKYIYMKDKGWLVDIDGYPCFYSTAEQIEYSTTIKRKAQDRILEQLIKKGAIKTFLKGCPPKKYFYIDEKVLISYFQQEEIKTISPEEFVLLSGENDDSICQKQENQIGQKGQIELVERDKNTFIYNNNNNIYKTNKGGFPKQGKSNGDMEGFLALYNRERKNLLPLARDITIIPEKAKRQFVAALKAGYSVEDIVNVFKNAAKAKNHIESSYKYLTVEFITRMDKIQLYQNIEVKKQDYEYIPNDNNRNYNVQSS
ncbi:MAG: hypothetical protein EOL88_02340 [Bacteroidia bacterium]|nr:hypothetical protein [Bacteroidia bacterium]